MKSGSGVAETELSRYSVYRQGLWEPREAMLEYAAVISALALSGLLASDEMQN